MANTAHPFSKPSGRAGDNETTPPSFSTSSPNKNNPSSRPPQPPPPAATSKKKPRILYLDNLRTALTVLVVYQHAASAYGADGAWHYVSAHHGRSLALIAFKAANRSFLMATFFFLSGYFSGLTARKRSRRAFLRDKMLRLGVPTALSTLLSGPLQLLVLRAVLEGGGVEWGVVKGYWGEVRGVRGPVWYTGLLLVFDTAYVLLRPGLGAVPAGAREKGEERPRAWLTRSRVLAAVVALALASFLVRVPCPIGRNFVPLSVRPGYVPQYLAAYALGVALAGQDPKVIPALRLGPSLLAMSVASGLGIAASGLLSAGSPLKAMRGGWNFPALAYAFWHESTGLLVFSALLDLFSTKRVLQTNWGAVGKYSYAAFLVHAPALVTFMGLLDGWYGSGVVKTAVVGTLGVVGSWVGGWLTAQIPGWRRCVI